MLKSDDDYLLLADSLGRYLREIAIIFLIDRSTEVALSRDIQRAAYLRELPTNGPTPLVADALLARFQSSMQYSEDLYRRQFPGVDLPRNRYQLIRQQGDFKVGVHRVNFSQT